MAYGLRKLVAVISNDIDKPAADFLLNILSIKGYIVQYLPAREVKKTLLGTITGEPELIDGNQSYVIIGGHKAPETGWISSYFLSDAEEKALEKLGAIVISGPHYKGYQVFVVAGHDYLDTKRAVEKFAAEVTPAVREEELEDKLAKWLEEETFGIKNKYLLLGGSALLALFILTRR